MARPLVAFEQIVRNAFGFTEEEEGGLREAEEETHPFDTRDIHPKLPQTVRKLFDNGHYPQATFEAFKFIDKVVQRLSGNKECGFKLMMNVFSDSSPAVQLTPCTTKSEIDEQKGYQFLFAGSVLAVRNPRGHECSFKDGPDDCLDHLSLASLLLRRLEQSGYKVT